MSKKATNPQNLKPFKKGVSGNPAGRPPKLPDLDKLLKETLGEQVQGREALKYVLLALRKKAIAGDVRATELLLDRAYGKLKLSTGLEIDIMKLSEGQLDQIINRLIKKEDVKKVE